MASKTIHTSLVIRGYCFSALISHESMYFKYDQNVGILLLFVVSHVVVKMAESFAANRSFSLSRNKKNKSKTMQCKKLRNCDVIEVNEIRHLSKF